jgi:hypothetical protein
MFVAAAPQRSDVEYETGHSSMATTDSESCVRGRYYVDSTAVTCPGCRFTAPWLASEFQTSSEGCARACHASEQDERQPAQEGDLKSSDERQRTTSTLNNGHRSTVL